MSKKVTLYHNPKCQKSRLALQELEEHGIAVDLVEYLKTMPTAKELKALCELLGIKPVELVRTTEPLYKEEYKGKTMTGNQWLKAMAEHPVLIQRPVVIKGKRAVIAREPGVLTEFLK